MPSARVKASSCAAVEPASRMWYPLIEIGFHLGIFAAQKVSPESLHRRSVLLEEARNSITQRNGAVRLQLERMLVEMMAVP